MDAAPRNRKCDENGYAYIRILYVGWALATHADGFYRHIYICCMSGGPQQPMPTGWLCTGMYMLYVGWA